MTNSKKGMILIDKSKGKKSPEATRKVSKLLGVKSGHCGALDPFATGLLPILLGKGVKIQEYLQKKNKEYHVEIETKEPVSKREMKKKLRRFKGVIKQTPPERSAVKREERERRIYEIEHLKKKGKKHTFRVKCQHGTYIRTLVKDLSKKLDTEADLTNLRRTKTGPWDVEQAIKLRKLEENPSEIDIIPLKEAIIEKPEIEIKKTALNTIKHGKDLKLPGIKHMKGEIREGEVAALTQNNELIAVGTSQIDKEKIKEKGEGIIVKTEKVIIEPE